MTNEEPIQFLPCLASAESVRFLEEMASLQDRSLCVPKELLDHLEPPRRTAEEIAALLDDPFGDLIGRPARVLSPAHSTPGPSVGQTTGPVSQPGEGDAADPNDRPATEQDPRADG